MIAFVCVHVNGRGSPTLRYTTIAIKEIANCSVKRWIGFPKSSWLAFIDKLQKLYKVQQCELSRVIYRSAASTHGIF